MFTILYRDEMKEGLEYYYISPISGDRGVGKIEVDRSRDNPVYMYKHPSSANWQEVSPSKSSAFVEVDDYAKHASKRVSN